MTRTAICGGGHLAHALAAVIAVDHPTTILTRRPFPRSPLIARTKSAAVVSEVQLVTDDPRSALVDVEVVLLAVPAFAHAEFLHMIAAHLPEMCWVGAVPGVGAFHEAAPKALNRDSRVFVTRESPFNCRIHERGRVVDILGIVPELGVATILPDESYEAAAILEGLLNIPVRTIAEPFAAMLRPVNILLHPIILLKLFSEQMRLGGFPAPPDLYASWDETCSDLYFAASGDLEEVARALKLREPSDIQPVEQHYKTNNPSILARLIRNLPGLSGLKAPCISREGRYFIDQRCRLIAEDVDIGVNGAIELAERVSCSVNNLRLIKSRFAEIRKYNIIWFANAMPLISEFLKTTILN